MRQGSRAGRSTEAWERLILCLVLSSSDQSESSSLGLALGGSEGTLLNAVDSVASFREPLNPA